ncbi:MAG: RsmB/NOP family class I SAM-dependent RNA methyltransferase, partial [Acidimicrobiales bacterium]
GAWPAWPDDATRLSYPDWIVERLETDLGRDQALAAMAGMNTAPPVHRRADGTVQDLASQWVAAHVGATRDDRVLDLCAGPGGKTTALAHTGAWVAAGDRSANRCELVAANARRVGVDARTWVLRLDGRFPPFRAGGFDRVLVDAPCSGLGALRRRADARWRIRPADVEVLARLQRSLLAAAASLVRPGGRLFYAVCTLSAVETLEVDRWAASALPDLAGPSAEEQCPPGSGWEPLGRGARLLPQAAGTDGMYVLGLLRRPGTDR